MYVNAKRIEIFNHGNVAGSQEEKRREEEKGGRREADGWIGRKFKLLSKG